MNDYVLRLLMQFSDELEQLRKRFNAWESEQKRIEKESKALLTKVATTYSPEIGEQHTISETKRED